MTTYTIQKYEASFYVSWNQFVSKSQNGTFLFHRDFMEYHQDRFQDFSLLVFEGTKIVALLPANHVGDAVYSHQGLTYGGLLYKDLKLAKVLEIVKQILFFLHTQGFQTLQVKCIPSMYTKKPSEELGYALFLLNAKLLRRDTLAVLNMNQKTDISKGRLEGVSKGIKFGLKVVEEPNFDSFWNTILIPNLHRKHQTKPVHSVEEIVLLHQKFPQNIRQFNVYFQGKIVAGTTIFESDLVAHAQYISANEDKNELGSLDFLYHHLITHVFQEKAFFDFGISNEEQGRKLNNGLSFWKESFGASTLLQDFYEVQISNFNLLDNVIL